MKKLLYILFHRSVLGALAVLAQVAILAAMVLAFSEYTQIFYWCCILASTAAAYARCRSLTPGASAIRRKASAWRASPARMAMASP